MKHIDENKLLQQGKRGILHIIFSRTMLIILMLLFNFYLVFSLMFGFLQDENGIRLYFYAGVMEMDVRDYDMGEYIWVGLGKMRDYLDGEEVEVVSRGLMKLY